MTRTHLTNYSRADPNGKFGLVWFHCHFKEGDIEVQSPGIPAEIILIDELLERLKGLSYDIPYRQKTLQMFKEYNDQWLT